MEKERINTVYVGISAAITLLSFGVRLTLPVTVGAILTAVGLIVFAKKTWIKWTAFLSLVMFNLFTSFFLGFPARYLMPVEGHVLDRMTEEPIENAILETEWIEHRATIVETIIGRLIDKTYTVSDKTGKYKIPGRVVPDFIYPNVDRYVRLRHPLFEPTDFSPGRTGMRVLDMECKDKERAANVFYVGRCDREISSKHGVIPYEIKLLKLEDKYKTDVKAGGKNVAWVLNDEMIPYATQARKLNLTIDWKPIFASWDKILGQFGESAESTKIEILRNAGGGM